MYETVFRRIAAGRVDGLPALLPDLIESALLPYVGARAAGAHARRLRSAPAVAATATSGRAVSAGRRNWLATTGCPGGEWPFEGETFFDNGSSASFASSVDCG